MASRNPTKDPTVVKRRLANAMHQAMQAKVDGKLGHHLGDVLSLDPIRCELHDQDLILVEHIDLLITQWVYLYHSNYGIEPEDNLVISFINGHYIAVDVLSDTDVTGA